jgi:hypothetical protein
MKARFFYKIPDAKLIRNKTDKNKGKEVEYIVERTIYLPKLEFIHFRSHLLEDDPNIIKYKKDMYVDDNGVWHVLMFCCVISDIMILVNSEGFKYTKYCAVINNGGEQVEKRYTTSNRYSNKQ